MTFIIGTPHAHNAGHYYNWNANGRQEQDDVKSCPHCEAVILLRTWKEEGGWCAKCNAPLCNNHTCIAETAKLGCVPFIKKLEAHIRATEKLDNLFKIAGLEPPVSPQPIYTGSP